MRVDTQEFCNFSSIISMNLTIANHCIQDLPQYRNHRVGCFLYRNLELSKATSINA